MQNLIIRYETANDSQVITDITVEAFKSLEISNHTEQFIVLALRAANALSVSLVAELNGKVVGHIAFSPVIISDGTKDWYGLGPVSVIPSLQNQGIGKALIEKGIEQLKTLGAKGCCLVGHPHYYRKFGFINVENLSITGVPKEVFFALSFDDCYPQGNVTFHEAFMAKE